MSKYIKPDSELGYVENSSEINYLKFNNMRHTVLGCMLGDFNDSGEYVVSPEIVKELIEMPKYITETMENMELCLSELKLDKQIGFLVTYEEDKATLSLIEKLSYEANIKLNSGTYSNINEYILDTVETSGEINRNTLYQKWNISQFEGTVVDVFNCDESILEKYFGIVNRFKYLLAANSKLLDKEAELEEVEAEYANELLRLIKQYPELEKVVLEQLKITFKEKEKFLQLNRPNYVKTLNEILDNLVMQNVGVLNMEQLAAFETDLHNLYNQIYLKRLGVIDIESVNNIETIDIKDLLSMSLQDLGAEFVKRVKGYKEIDKKSKEELSKLISWLYAKKLIEENKKEEEKSKESKVEDQAKDLVKSAAAKKADAKKADAKKADKKSAAKKPAAKKAENKKAAKPAKKPAPEVTKEEKPKNLIGQATKRKRKKKVYVGYYAVGTQSTSGKTQGNTAVNTPQLINGKLVASGRRTNINGMTTSVSTAVEPRINANPVRTNLGVEHQQDSGLGI